MNKEQKLQAAVVVIRLIAANSKSPFVTRKKVPIITGGLIAAGTMANLDSLGGGVPGAFRIGRQICYPVNALCDWLINRLEA
jgi:hypothetical protein